MATYAYITLTLKAIILKEKTIIIIKKKKKERRGKERNLEG